MFRGARPDPAGSPARYFLLALALLVAVGSILPGTFVDSWADIAADLKAGTATLAVQDPGLVTVLERFASFLPLGWLAWWHLARRGCRRPIVWSCATVILFALALEVAQSAVASRHARLSDFALAAIFGCVGARIGAWLGTEPAPATIRRLLVSALVLGNGLISLAVALGHRGAELTGWDCSFPLLVANERSEDRPWLGRIRGLAIYPRQLSTPEIERLADEPPLADRADMRAAMGALAVYSFAALQGRRAPQLLPHGPGIDLLLPEPGSSTWQVERDALEVRGPMVIKSAGAAREICEAVMASGAFAVEVEIASAPMAQEGPARIVSHSLDPYARNFTLGEQFGSLVLRVRTPWNGPNGMHLPLQTEGAVLTDGWHHIVFGYGGGTATLFLDGVEIVPPLAYHQMMMVIEQQWAVRLAGVAAPIFLALGVLAAFILAPRPPRLMLLVKTYALTALVPTLIAVTFSAWFGHVQDGLLLTAALLGPGVGLIVGLALRKRLVR